MACDTAKSKGGDAIVIRYGGEFGVGMITGGAADPQVVSVANDTTALVIKWLSPSEVQAAKAVAARLLDQFQKEHPEIVNKPELTDIATEYVRSLGLALDSEEAIQTFNQVLNSVLIPPKDGQSNWLYRGIVRMGSLTTSQSDTMYGLAGIVRTGDNVTIVSKSKASDLTFSGTVQNSTLSGQLGITIGGTIVSTKAEGVITGEKISLTGQGQTPDGTILTSVSFSH